VVFRSGEDRACRGHADEAGPSLAQRMQQLGALIEQAPGDRGADDSDDSAWPADRPQ
jgi:hypothetical protein